jgi:acetate kinase
MSTQGTRRRGGFGLFHEWAGETVRSVCGEKALRVISIFLGNKSNIAAIKDGEPFETTMGFSPTEGLPSDTACGNIDPTIVFELFFNGSSLYEINKFLSKKSGFSGMLGKKCELKDLLESKDGDEELSQIRKMFIYNVIKYVGEFTAILGGVDAITFGAAYSEETMRFIAEICSELQFLNLKLVFAEASDKSRIILTAPDSKVSVVFVHYTKWNVLAEKCHSFVRGLQ